jgi:hypothetical protein
MYYLAVTMVQCDSINKLNEAIKMINTYSVIKTSDVKELDAGQCVIGISRTDGKKGKSGFCAVIDAFGSNNLQSAMLDATGKAWLIEQVESLRSRMASELNKNGKPLNAINLGYDAILKAMTLENESQRMTKEAIKNWFNSELAVLLQVAIAEKFPHVNAQQVAKMVQQFDDKFQSLAGRDVSMNDKEKQQLEKALFLLGEDYQHPMADKIAEKLANVTEAGSMIDAL